MSGMPGLAHPDATYSATQLSLAPTRPASFLHVVHSQRAAACTMPKKHAGPSNSGMPDQPGALQRRKKGKRGRAGFPHTTIGSQSVW